MLLIFLLSGIFLSFVSFLVIFFLNSVSRVIFFCIGLKRSVFEF